MVDIAQILPKMRLIALALGMLVCLGLLATAASRPASAQEQALKIVEKPPDLVLTVDRAVQVRQAINRGDFATAQKISDEVLSQSKMIFGGFYPFTAFIANVGQYNNKSFLGRLNAWATGDADAALPYLFRSLYYYQTGWLIRGEKFIEDTGDDHVQAFHEHLRLAAADADRVLQITKRIPYAYALALNIALVATETERASKTFIDGAKLYPDYYELYRLVLRYSTPKWGGSIYRMKELVDYAAGQASETSPLKLLYLRLYADMLDTAHINCNKSHRNDFAACMSGTLKLLIPSDITAGVRDALDEYKTVDHYYYGFLLEDILFDIVSSGSADAAANQILQWAADRMNTDTQLAENDPGHNNYVLDLITAQVWRRSGHDDNAATKYKEALRDLDNIKFPGDEEKYLAIADVYNRLSYLDLSLSNFEEAIALRQAAVSFAGDAKDGYQHIKCYGYFRLARYDQAIEDCTKQVDDHFNLSSLYWRGQSYKMTGKYDEALKDFQVLADSEHGFRFLAAIEMSVIYGTQKKYKEELDVLNQYPYLFARERSRDDLAVSYNNRCHAYMELGALEKALDDCNQSIKYGNIPDAYQKKQKLEEMLKKSIKN